MYQTPVTFMLMMYLTYHRWGCHAKKECSERSEQKLALGSVFNPRTLNQMQERF
jgi:hypothetical protein